jgi:hypothetical protein
MSAVRVTTEDLETGEKSTFVLPPGNYAVICAEPCHLAHEQHYATGTSMITVKGRAPDLMALREVQPTKPAEPTAEPAGDAR